MRAGLRAIAYWAFIVASLASVPAFLVASMVGDATPEWQPYAGSVNFIENSTDSLHSVKIEASIIGDPKAAEPRMSYRAVVCGKGSFSGFLVFRGAARLRGAEYSPEITQLGGAWSLGLVPSDSKIMDRIGPSSQVAQAFKLSISETAPCAPGTSGGAAQPSDPWVGTPVEVDGNSMGRILYVGHRVGLEGPKEVETWPLIGAFDVPSQSMLGEFEGSGVLAGKYMRPPILLTQVDANIPFGTHVDSARPEPSSTAGLTWDSFSSTGPVAELTNEDVATRWQDWTVFTSIWFGVGAAFLGAVVFEWARLRNKEQGSPNEEAPDVVREEACGEGLIPIRVVTPVGEQGSGFGYTAAASAGLVVAAFGFALGRRMSRSSRAGQKQTG
ncbi:hypothetical protein ACIGXM_36580 [Kitasatospora sp. NPDC052896]|uniref:hypothetical protein n=1 Tax=Kitasatospora sp. NPDC052896 TaxID=3364061 RepID=UPI0037CA4062